MAGLGRRTFAAGEVLTAGNVMGYLQDQAVMNFAGTAARGSAVGTAVAQGMMSFQQDTGTVETYYGAFGTANPGGRDSAGWFANSSTDGMIPMKPTSVSVPGGSVTVGALNKITYSSTSASNGITVNGCFTSAYRNYKVIITVVSGQANFQHNFQLTQSGTPSTSAYMTASSDGSTGTGNPNLEIMFGNYLGTGATSLEIFQPAETITTSITHDWLYDDGGTFIYKRKGTRHRQVASYDGFKIYGPTSITATIQIFGYNW